MCRFHATANEPNSVRFYLPQSSIVKHTGTSSTRTQVGWSVDGEAISNNQTGSHG